MMIMKQYGDVWSAEEFHKAVMGLGPQWDISTTNIEWFADDLRGRGHYNSFKEALRSFLVDGSMTFGDKGKLYLEDMDTAGEAWDYFKWIWEHFAPGEPWPLEGQERPKD